jgi:hypothetical protein
VTQEFPCSGNTNQVFSSLLLIIALEMGRPVKKQRLLLRSLIKDHLGEKGLKWWWTTEELYLNLVNGGINKSLLKADVQTELYSMCNQGMIEHDVFKKKHQYRVAMFATNVAAAGHQNVGSIP